MSKFIDLKTLPIGSMETAQTLASDAKFNEGVKFALDFELESIGMTANKYWFGRSRSGADITSRESIGYHMGSTAFFRGMMYVVKHPPTFHYDDGSTALIRTVYADLVNDAWQSLKESGAAK